MKAAVRFVVALMVVSVVAGVTTVAEAL
ncbi:MAG: hypothetical protein QOE25_793, partial [Actinomycetota bacterium]|nr:hypothetical protein [Actinomycetota bacterium]